MVFSPTEQRNLMTVERDTVVFSFFVFMDKIKNRVENEVIAHRYPPTDRERGKMQFVDTN